VPLKCAFTPFSVPSSLLLLLCRRRRYRPSVPLAFIATSLAFPSVAEARKLITASGGVLVRAGTASGADGATPSPRVSAADVSSSSANSGSDAAAAADDAAAGGGDDDGDDAGWALDCKASAGRIVMVRELTAEEAAQAALVAEQTQAATAAAMNDGGGGYGDDDEDDDDDE
jgi:hypothetical protein